MKKVYGKNGVANVRIYPDTTSEVIGTIDKTKGFELIRTTEKNPLFRWHVVFVGKSIGYVREDVSVVKEESKERIIEGYSFPDAPIRTNLKVSFSKEMREKYIPEINKLKANKGVKLLATIMANKEGFKAGTRSFRTNNPGNIGNTDSGANVSYETLKAGIEAQIRYIETIANGTNKAHKFGIRTIKPFYSQEIARNQKTYGIDPNLPGYRFDYKGQLGGFVKIYSTGARGGNGYLSQIISYFKENGIIITEHSTISEIVSIK